MSVVLKLVGLVNGGTTPYDGQYLRRYDPTWHLPGGQYDGGLLEVTPNPWHAERFPDMRAAMKKYREEYGIRPDGLPNRPLTAYSVEVITWPEQLELLAEVEADYF